jgi:hypothetical protein
MPTRFQLVMDVHDPVLEAKFWAGALGYVLEPPPDGFATWSEFWDRVGLPEEDRSPGPDSIIDPTGRGPRVWFHVMAESKTMKNRLHLDLGVSGGFGVPLSLRKERVEAEVARLIALGASRLETLALEGFEHYAVAMADPEGNEFDVN